MSKNTVQSSNATTIYRVIRIRVDITEIRDGQPEINLQSLNILQRGDLQAKAVRGIGDKKWIERQASSDSSSSLLRELLPICGTGPRSFRLFHRFGDKITEIDEGEVLSVFEGASASPYLEVVARGNNIIGEWVIKCQPKTLPCPMSGGVMCVGVSAVFAVGMSLPALGVLARSAHFS